MKFFCIYPLKIRPTLDILIIHNIYMETHTQHIDVTTISDNHLIHHKEKTYFTISLIFSLALWVVLTLITFGTLLLCIAFGILFGFIIKKIYLAHIQGYGVEVTEHQFGEWYTEVKRISHEMHLKEIPKVYIYNMNGILNAFAFRIFSRHFVVISTATLEACNDDISHISFVLAHEIAHHVRKHTHYVSLLLPSRILPWLGNAYSRACEYTCDALAMKYGTRNKENTLEGISILATTSLARSKKINGHAYITQAKDVEDFWPAVVLTNATHPFTSMRFARINMLTGGNTKMPTPHILGRLFAPVFSFEILIVLYVVFTIGLVMTAKTNEEKHMPTPVMENNIYNGEENEIQGQ